MIYWKDIPQFTKQGSYSVDISWEHLDSTIQRWSQDQVVDLDPDFQRDHVWTTDKQVSYVEYIMRGGYAAREIYWNCTTWGRGYKTPVELVDGKQRLEAVSSFIRGDLKAFGYYRNEYDLIDMMNCRMRWYVNDLTTRKQVLQWYLDLNTGGVLHTKQELDKVRLLLEGEE